MTIQSNQSTDSHATDHLGYTSGGLKRETGWWGAFVIGLAGTILVTGIAPVMVTSLGAASIPITVFITLTGWLLCLFLAELAAMMPERTGGSPSYAYPAFVSRWPKFAKHVNGFTAWAYWLGWFPVAPLNMILAAGLSRRPFRLQHHGRLHADPYLHRLVDVDHLGDRHLAVLHSGLSGDQVRRGLRHSAGFAVDDPADVHRGLPGSSIRASCISANSPASNIWTGQASSHRSAASTGCRFISPMASC